MLAIGAATSYYCAADGAFPSGADGRVRFGHPSGTLEVGAEVRKDGNHWKVTKVMMSRSARRLMEGWVRVPA